MQFWMTLADERGKLLFEQSQRIEALDTALRYYATQYCEGWCKDAPAHADFDDCGGCRARAALAEGQDK